MHENLGEGWPTVPLSQSRGRKPAICSLDLGQRKLCFVWLLVVLSFWFHFCFCF